jgi:hypothetical protein
VEDQDHYFGQEPGGQEPGGQARPARAESFRGVIFGRGAGWAVAAILAGAVVALSILLAEGQGPSSVRVIGGPPFVQVAPGAQALAPPGIRAVGPGGLRIAIPRGIRLLPPGCRQVPATPIPSASASATPASSASAAANGAPGSPAITVVGPGSARLTCVIQVKPGR